MKDQLITLKNFQRILILKWCTSGVNFIDVPMLLILSRISFTK